MELKRAKRMSDGFIALRWSGISLGRIPLLVTLEKKGWHEQQRWYSCQDLTARRSSSDPYLPLFLRGLNQSWSRIRYRVPTITRTCWRSCKRQSRIPRSFTFWAGRSLAASGHAYRQRSDQGSRRDSLCVLRPTSTSGSLLAPGCGYLARRPPCAVGA